MYIALYVSEASVLFQWDVPIELLDISDKSKIYKLGITVLSFVLLGTITVYAVLYVKSRTFFAKHLAAMRVKVKLLEAEASDNETEINALKSDIKTLKRFSKKEVFKKLVLPILLLGILYLSINANTFGSSKAIIVSWVLLPMIYLFSLLNEWCHTYSSAKDEFKKTASIPEKYLDIDKCLNYSLITGIDFSSELFSTVRNILIALVLVLFVTTCVEGKYDAEHQDSFPIVYNGSKASAVVYLTKSYAVLEDSIIDSKKITINTSQQKVIDVTDLHYSVIKFDEVIKTHSKTLE